MSNPPRALDISSLKTGGVGADAFCAANEDLFVTAATRALRAAILSAEEPPVGREDEAVDDFPALSFAFNSAALAFAAANI